ncbi:hypothetical protein KKG65_00905 [Patescibacteria group bacterium]|nr:hypothetical protein [Patescibacteria group bacterium]
MQVCTTIEDQDTLKRELHGLTKACKLLGLKKGTIITLDQEQKIKQEDISISVIPAWKYFL